tara:strand:- start:3883 stop:5424 length:1542 start_codon:yes stop_codon:yes gene_type:complete
MEENTTSTKKVATNTAILYGRMLLTVFISLYSTRLVLGALGADDFGVFAVVASTIAMFGFLNGAMASATQRFMSYSLGVNNLQNQKETFNVSVVLHLAIGVVVVLILEIISLILFDFVLNLPPGSVEVAKKIFQFMILGTFFMIISVPYSAVIMAHENMLFVALLGILESILKFLIACTVVYVSENKLFYYGLLMSILSLITLVVHVIYCHSKYDEVVFKIKEYFNFIKFKEMTTFSGWSFLGIASTMITSQGQGLMLNVFFGTTVNAAHGIADQIKGQLTVLANILLKALNPAITKTEGGGNRENMISLSLMGSRISFFLLMIVEIFFIIEMPFIFNLWLKSVPEFAIIFCRLLLLRTLLEQMFIPLITSIYAVGNIRRLNLQFTILCLFPLPLTYYFFKIDYPPYTMYLIYVIYSLFWGYIILRDAQRKCGIDIKKFMVQVLVPCSTVFLLTFIVSLIPFYLLNQGIYRTCLTLMVSVFSSGLLIWFLGLMRNEKEGVQNILTTILRKYKL